MLRPKLRSTRSRQPRGLTVEVSTFSLVSKDFRTFTLVLPSSAICSSYLVSSLRQRQIARSNDLNIKCRVEFASRHTASRQARCRGGLECMRVWFSEEDSKYLGPLKCATAYGGVLFWPQI
ncbi:hypothetical protein ARMGADRAFT_615900 [Armillaria gallica]|uniref:Uncharacterized protein n=1 Tax=Armillaria gallica TaxID=47427 RepID=A0A2H3CXV4_ARMGA|nr:hypothetical protein ARMGADRAFT_615900 [Armillaria gallica]